MKKSLQIIFFLLIIQSAFGQKRQFDIDKINTKEDIESLIHSFDKEYERFKLKKLSEFEISSDENNLCKKNADSLQITDSFYKSDFDNNGFTDILVIGEYYEFNIFVVMNYGKDSLKLNRLTRRSFQDCVFPKISNDSIINYYYLTEPHWNSKDKPKLISKQLIYKFEDFVEYNKAPKKYNIEKIEYQTTMCFGTCPKFKLILKNDKTAIFNAENYNRKSDKSKEIMGNFKASIDEISYSKIVDLLNYIDFPELNDNYSVNWTDDQSCILKITYNGGKVKTIGDYGLIGTYGLDRLYQLLFDLRFNQNWKK